VRQGEASETAGWRIAMGTDYQDPCRWDLRGQLAIDVLQLDPILVEAGLLAFDPCPHLLEEASFVLGQTAVPARRGRPRQLLSGWPLEGCRPYEPILRRSTLSSAS
jgi:hypothetical protein